ncbi:isopenicillin N synthase family dioxygenase [Acinetobacter shaoyimingii]|uniref:2-oxoglutarate-dependent ethylene/succinate-forming enzyme n=1 Tax=Acinetobacter shaoyimingii TaxID=2715164 RepID=A0A6G8RVZ4_9GAMM|nr:isopenicillin N synthase family oxygenase [Acinetobacter shaoyimingii]QIO05893.1 isopenicillin N synthase family oxygenase [Acinetobacter shaoyimingii]
MQSQYVLPLVDISKMHSPNLTDRLEVAHALDQACKDVGFLYLKGTQFNFDYAQQLIELAKSYFAKDLDTKMQHYIGQSQNHSGYVPIGEEQFAGQSYDLKEAYDVNYDYLGSPTDCPLLGPTLWPEDAHFKSIVSQYYGHLRGISAQIFQAFALALNVDEHYFDEKITHAPSQLRLIHYPYHPEVQDAEGIGAHTDYECFTLLLPTAPGLQVLNKAGEWIDIPLIPDTLIMNIGDMMEILSNGKYLATKHRVKKVAEERYSFPLFCACNYDTVIEPVIHDQDSKYQALIGGEHLFNQTAQTFAYLKRRVASGELVLKNAVPLSSFGLNEQLEDA